MSGRLSLIGQNQPMLNPSNFGGPFELGAWGNFPLLPSPLGGPGSMLLVKLPYNIGK